MGYSLNNYADFAENDYIFFKQAYNNGNLGSPLAALGQSICERYLKHIISEYSSPENETEQIKKENILRTHSLNKLMRYIKNDMEIDIPSDAESVMERIDGYYFTTRYPGDDSFIATEHEISLANNAIDACRDFTLDIVKEFEELEEKEAQTIDDNFEL